ncbi:aldo/keto reductase [Enterovibrio norvegicus]|uniref:Oxidoreductase n=1 Tax=Enterovibrio norvegicus TaxID=188144 RepID=A0A2N7L8S1_9GAMM|nr:aldo/keto reductase [Enterovibrio norvegicus]PMN90660.1 oxidoreductase [Enterovibrio norvegicus]
MSANTTDENASIIAGFWRTNAWGYSTQALNQFIEQLVDIGVKDFDHAYVYRSEAVFGQALSLSPNLRENINIITKCGIRGVGDNPLDATSVNHYDSSKATILASVDHSLKALGTDYVDTLLLHRPDYLMDVDAVNDAFNTLKAQGKVKQFGVSNFNTAQFSLLQSTLDEPLITNQIELSPFETSALDNGLLDQCYQHRIRPMIWSCLGGGRLFDTTDAVTQRLTQGLSGLMEEVGVSSLAELIYAWVLTLPSQPQIITGSGKIENIRPLVNARDIRLTREQWYQVWSAAVGHGVK